MWQCEEGVQSDAWQWVVGIRADELRSGVARAYELMQCKGAS